MFEEIASDAVRTLIFLFWSTLVVIIIFGALWIRACRKDRQAQL
ncbi:MAG: hypothetical protein OEY22_04370 [Candidatus Bathyarchaeota archaeon]|nr:hypothetical protein [Candidatus Bathyarchaeota archaeon]